ncbi:PilZ domain-containing protein [Novosphingobium cyanobacteriorum]|uniref:PilZ domain-containing protein n=1 Tax=Novosphingobium cyanobacteriorum TaxID=3024215 RepID=A0ABT6CML9_9SPHN|nr:PilZ domain-containing protein [Novosphingobium cyanobacteriorum]MDF8335170.1 PilZ domain-containing protein [Novosphingobium cyanobacteriorum]
MKLNPISLFRRKRFFARSAERHACQVQGELVLTDSMVTYEGRLINISAGGAMFRPRLAYLMHRRDVEIELHIAGKAIAGTIVATTPAGFGIRFAGLLDQKSIADILAAQRDLAQAA